jgi:hypothetical protein
LPIAVQQYCGALLGAHELDNAAWHSPIVPNAPFGYDWQPEVHPEKPYPMGALVVVNDVVMTCACKADGVLTNNCRCCA